MMASWPPVSMGLQPNLAGKENMFLNKNPGLDVILWPGPVCVAKGVHILAQHYDRCKI